MSKLSAEDRDDLDKGAFAFPAERKEPLENASHVRNAIARFNQAKASATTSAMLHGNGSSPQPTSSMSR